MRTIRYEHATLYFQYRISGVNVLRSGICVAFFIHGVTVCAEEQRLIL